MDRNIDRQKYRWIDRGEIIKVLMVGTTHNKTQHKIVLNAKNNPIQNIRQNKDKICSEESLLQLE